MNLDKNAFIIFTQARKISGEGFVEYPIRKKKNKRYNMLNILPIFVLRYNTPKLEIAMERAKRNLQKDSNLTKNEEENI